MASTAMASLHAAFHRLSELADLPPDWDSYGAVAPGAAAIADIQRVIEEAVR